MADTLSANIAESVTELVAGTVALMPQKAPCIQLVTRVPIPKGHDRVEIPRVNSTSSVQTPTEGDELSLTSQFDLTSTTIQPTYRAIFVRVHERAEYFARDDLIRLITEEMSQTQAQDVDTDILAEFTNFATGNDVGTTNTDLILAVIRKARRLLMENPRSTGGPVVDNINLVLAPQPLEDLLTNLGVQGAVANTSPWVPAGISEDIIRRYHVPLTNSGLVGVNIFWDGYMTVDGSSDYICGMFAKKAIHFAISKDWKIRTFEEAEWPGTILRSTADYNTGIGAFTQWGCQVTADGP